MMSGVFKNICGAANTLKTSLLRMTTASQGPIQKAITEALQQLEPTHLQVVNDSPAGAESHFRVLIVSKQFDDLSLIKRHRMVNKHVLEKLKGEFVHAMSIDAYTPKQWKEL